MYPLCETSDSSDEIAFSDELGDGQRIQYLGCFNDELDKDGDGQRDCGNNDNDNVEYGLDGLPVPNPNVGECRDLSGPHFVMAEASGKAKCAELCAGYAYFATYASPRHCDPQELFLGAKKHLLLEIPMENMSAPICWKMLSGIL